MTEDAVKLDENAVKAEIEDLSPITRKLKIVVPAAEVTLEVDRAYRELGRRAKVKGFRPGKVPRSVLEMYYRKQIEQDVSDALVRRSLAKVLKDKGLEPINLSWPEAPPPALPGQEYRYSVELEVSPEFSVSDYLGLKLAAPEVEVTDAEVEKRLEEIRQGNALLKPPAEARGVQTGDFVILDYQVYFAGQPVEDAKAEETYIEVGSGKFNHDFEHQLIGLQEGAEARFAVSLPEDFAKPLLAGKVVDFQVKIQEVKEKVVPELDDTFAQNLGGNFQTVADLRMALREDIIKKKEQERQAHLENQVADQLIAAHQFEVPPSLLRQEHEDLLRDQMERYRQMGLDPAHMDADKMLEVLQPMAERRVKLSLILDRIAAQEDLAVDEAEEDAALARIAVNSGRDVAEVKRFYEEHGLKGSLRRRLRHDKTMKLLLDNAEINAAAVPAEEADAAAEEQE
jgi:trigger factor